MKAIKYIGNINNLVFEKKRREKITIVLNIFHLLGFKAHTKWTKDLFIIYS